MKGKAMLKNKNQKFIDWQFLRRIVSVLIGFFYVLLFGFLISNIINLRNLLLGKPRHPSIPNLRESRDDSLFFEGLIRGTLVSGNPGTGKTTWVAMLLVAYTLTYPERPLFLFDYSGSCINEFIQIVYSLPREKREAILGRIVLDIPGHETWVVPKPLFSPAYGLTDEDLVKKAKNILEELNPELMARNPMMSRAIKITAPNLFKLLSAIQDEAGNPWQITEAMKLLLDCSPGGELAKACKRFGGRVPDAKWYLEKELLRQDITPTGSEARTTALIGELGIIEPRPLRARYGYGWPMVTEKEIIDKGLIYMLSGEMLTNQPDAQAWVFWDAFSSLRAVINQRTPHDPQDEPVLLAVDEIPKVLEIKGMAKAFGDLTTYYRSRKLMLMMIIQAHWQLDDLLQEQVWNLGNQVLFALDNFNDAYKSAQQLSKYDARGEKLPALSLHSLPVFEPDRGQYLTMANWLQHLQWRQVVMRRYLNERDKEPFINFVNRTSEKPQDVLSLPQLFEVKEALFKRRAIPVKDALNVINKKKMAAPTRKRPTA
jgi:hypothetical protein